LTLTPNRRFPPAVPASREGRIAIVTDVGCGMRWTRQRQAHTCGRRMTLQADGEAVWSWRPDAGVKFSQGDSCLDDGGKTAGHRGEHGVSVKTIAQGMPVDAALPVVTTLMCFFHFAREAMGAAAHPAFPAPSAIEGGPAQQLGRDRRRGVHRLAWRNISPLAKVAATGQKKAGNKKRQRRTS
jgi:hypothetical protein